MAAIRPARAKPVHAPPGFVIHPSLGLIVFEDVPDPDAPNRTIRRRRRVDPLIGILGGGKRDPRQWPQDGQERLEAAERYRDAVSLAAGARPPPTARRSGFGDLCADDIRVMAQARVRGMLALITPAQIDVIGLIALGGHSIAYTAHKLRCRQSRVSSELIDGLDRWRLDNPG